MCDLKQSFFGIDYYDAFKIHQNECTNQIMTFTKNVTVWARRMDSIFSPKQEMTLVCDMNEFWLEQIEYL